MVVGFTTACTCAISAITTDVVIRSWRGVLVTTLCDKVCQWLATGHAIYLKINSSSDKRLERHYVKKYSREHKDDNVNKRFF